MNKADKPAREERANRRAAFGDHGRRARHAIRALTLGLLLVLAPAAVLLSQPLPQPAPERGDVEEPTEELPERMDAPAQRPSGTEDDAEPAQDETAGDDEPAESDTKPDEAPARASATSDACLGALAAIGARAARSELVSGENGCGIEDPVILHGLPGDVALEPEALLNCDAAQGLARFARDEIEALARSHLKSRVTRIAHASAYVCRQRAGQDQLSEHARGNAFDFSSFELEDGRTVPVQAFGPGADAERDFIRALRGATCGPFTTVLGPGTDAAHADHIHVDLAERRPGSTYCR